MRGQSIHLTFEPLCLARSEVLYLLFRISRDGLAQKPLNSTGLIHRGARNQLLDKGEALVTKI
jgi:hypothetical protein